MDTSAERKVAAIPRFARTVQCGLLLEKEAAESGKPQPSTTLSKSSQTTLQGRMLCTNELGREQFHG